MSCLDGWIPLLNTIRNSQTSPRSLQGKYAEAEPLCRRASEIMQAVMGPDDLLGASFLPKLARVLKDRVSVVIFQLSQMYGGTRA